MGSWYDDADATGVAAAIAAGEVSEMEVLELALARIDERNPAINAIVARRDSEARAEVASGLPAGPLHGVPMVIKDLAMTVAGMPATGGSRLFADVIAPVDSALVAAYRAAGAVIVGMSNTPELGKNESTEPVLFGPARNPRHLDYSTGGSSGGSAAAVAAGIVPVAHGNDGGGSIRIPASMNGLIGLKPSRGRVSPFPSPSPIANPLAINHVIARSVRDTALILDITHGPHPGDAYVIAPPTRPYLTEVGAPVERLRIALSTTLPTGEEVDPQCAAAVRRFAEVIGALGHDVVEATPDYSVADYRSVMQVMMAVTLARQVDDRLAQLGRPLADDDLEPVTRMMYDMAQTTTGTAVGRALDSIELVARRFGAFFEDHDLLLTPTIGRTVPPIGLLDPTDPAALAHRGKYSALTAPFNVSGQPAISLPAGHDTNGLPLGAQLVGRFGAEDVLIRVAAQLEAASAWTIETVDPTA